MPVPGHEFGWAGESRNRNRNNSCGNKFFRGPGRGPEMLFLRAEGARKTAVAGASCGGAARFGPPGTRRGWDVERQSVRCGELTQQKRVGLIPVRFRQRSHLDRAWVMPQPDIGSMATAIVAAGCGQHHSPLATPGAPATAIGIPSGGATSPKLGNHGLGAWSSWSASDLPGAGDDVCACQGGLPPLLPSGALWTPGLVTT